MKLCKECALKNECVENCKDAVEFESMDNSKNYRNEPYRALGKPVQTWFDVRQSGGLSRFK